MTNRDINHILARFDRTKATLFDAVYADSLYEEYKSNKIEDRDAKKDLKLLLEQKEIFIIAPDPSINQYKEKIKKYIKDYQPIVISVNFIPEFYTIDYAFFSNNKRFDKLDSISCKTIVTSNLTEGQIDYNSLSGAFNQGCNSLIMLLILLKDMKVKKITIVGADGYNIGEKNYYSSNIRNYTEHGKNFNIAVANAIHNLDITVEFLTPSAYDRPQI